MNYNAISYISKLVKMEIYLSDNLPIQSRSVIEVGEISLDRVSRTSHPRSFLHTGSNANSVAFLPGRPAAKVMLKSAIPFYQLY
jgi:hypothetical protein